MPVIMNIDVTTDDKITYKEIKYDFSLMLEDRKIHIIMQIFDGEKNYII